MNRFYRLPSFLLFFAAFFAACLGGPGVEPHPNRKDNQEGTSDGGAVPIQTRDAGTSIVGTGGAAAYNGTGGASSTTATSGGTGGGAGAAGLAGMGAAGAAGGYAADAGTSGAAGSGNCVSCANFCGILEGGVCEQCATLCCQKDAGSYDAATLDGACCADGGGDCGVEETEQNQNN